MKRLAAPFSMVSHASEGAFLHSVNFRIISVVKQKGMFEKNLIIFGLRKLPLHKILMIYTDIFDVLEFCCQFII